ncbi:uncharacterized protein PHACADRAFT_262665 [Phanerochaete carnosa HHB-10118-sp]|uniref:Uncharacterized protein n=1 Tax=Phanerochaete carnosa (strain HHB-10118-sp) TaxID=650164 RepID=K5VL54_PHACS|nr:uncharacterized protein PHACADRAFT_262665 [Phanerochaete carnosa HHB-10118-sp]EKM52153.1 hypothetical protein PHACADRAFT_262665 [Phanerochaete carnosa HHB-10118-sp]
MAGRDSLSRTEISSLIGNSREGTASNVTFLSADDGERVLSRSTPLRKACSSLSRLTSGDTALASTLVFDLASDLLDCSAATFWVSFFGACHLGSGTALVPSEIRRLVQFMHGKDSLKRTCFNSSGKYTSAVVCAPCSAGKFFCSAVTFTYCKGRLSVLLSLAVPTLQPRTTRLALCDGHS